MSIPLLSAGSPSSEITEALNEAGCVVVTGVTDAGLRKSVKDELEQHMEKANVVEEDDPEDFYAPHTRRVTALVARSPTITDQLVAHPLSKQCCETLLLPNGEFGYQLHITAALEVGPGARTQTLHRDDNSFTFFPVPRPNLIVASMWAITDFRANNGATLSQILA